MMPDLSETKIHIKSEVLIKVRASTGPRMETPNREITVLSSKVTALITLISPQSLPKTIFRR